MQAEKKMTAYAKRMNDRVEQADGEQLKYDKLISIVRHFALKGEVKDLRPYGHGHINDTYKLLLETDHDCLEVILQRVNRHVFPDVEALMDNIEHVTHFLSRKLRALGRDPYRETLTLIRTLDGRPYYRTADGDYYRVCVYIPDAVCYNQANSERLMYENGAAFGDFAFLLHDFPAAELHEIIPGFHDTAKRFKHFQMILAKDSHARAPLARQEIEFFLSHEALATNLSALKTSGELPLRVTHNDTKLNNVLFSSQTGKAMCVIDLDTVMPGSYVDDFGDSIRFGASTALEDEPNLERVHFNERLFESYAAGYLDNCGEILTKAEIEALAMGTAVLTYECGMRFLTDYLDGDRYFKIAAQRPEHNLERARTQMRLVQEMLERMDSMRATVRELAARPTCTVPGTVKQR